MVPSLFNLSLTNQSLPTVPFKSRVHNDFRFVPWRTDKSSIQGHKAKWKKDFRATRYAIIKNGAVEKAAPGTLLKSGGLV